MRVSRFDWDGSNARALAAEIRALQPVLGEVASEVAAIIDEVRDGGDEALRRLEERLGGAAPDDIRVPGEAIKAATESALGEKPELRSALELAASNVRAVAKAEAQSDRESEAELGAGQVVRNRSVPVQAAGAYVPGGEAPYPSTAIMCCVPARAAGVERLAVASPAGPDGEPNELILAAASIGGADDVYAVGGAQAIAALALGTESIEPVDVIVGPGNRYVQEAKRQLFGTVGIDGIAGPSELMAIVDREANPHWIALDLCAQAEHGTDGLLVAAAAEDGPLDELAREVEALAGSPGSTVGDAPLALVCVPSAEAAVELTNAIAPEHLEIATDGADVLAEMVRGAGCVFTGPYGATAFGDFAAGSNHVLPTGGAGRFAGPLGPRSFRRRVASVMIPPGAARELAPTVATLARAEGFPVHAVSVEVRGESS
jgi:histidinol dehydrogenase